LLTSKASPVAILNTTLSLRTTINTTVDLPS
jgi:hypothetical protein